MRTLRFPATLLTLAVVGWLFGASVLKAHEFATRPEDTGVLYACPAHPEVTDRWAAKCFKCSQPLVPVPGGVSDGGSGLPGGAASHAHAPRGRSTLRAEVRLAGPPVPGQNVPATLRLSQLDGRPATFADLETAHTKKIHLLVVDPSLGDYHHEHPTETDTPGEFLFNFHPVRGGNYRVWADVVPTATGQQEYVLAEVEVPGPPSPLYPTASASATAAGGYRFDLTLPKGVALTAERATLVKVRVTRPDGEPATELEPLMGAFAHGVGFPADRSGVLHVHPLGAEPTDDTARGGPELEFHLLPEKAGYTRFYVQVQLGGQDVFAGFGLNIRPPAPAPLVVAAASANSLGEADRRFLETYETLRAALAADDLPGMKRAAAALGEAGAAAVLRDGDSLPAGRAAFRTLSGDAIRRVAGQPGFFVMHCPMVQDGDWVQTSERVENPYMGKAMLRCGAVKE